MSLIKKNPKKIGYIISTIGVFLFMPYVQTILVSTFVVLAEPEKLSVSDYFMFLVESFGIQYIYTIPAVVLIIIGIWLIKKK